MKKIDRRESDRRAAERFVLPMKGSAVFKAGSKEQQREIQVENISAYGAYFLADLCPEVSETVRIHLPIEDSEGPFKATATVVRVDQVAESRFGIGVKFDEVPHFD